MTSPLPPSPFSTQRRGKACTSALNRFDALMKPVWVFLRLCFAALLALGSVPLSAVEVTSGPDVDVTGTQAIVRWTTDVECGATVRFGTTPAALHRTAKSGQVGREHAVTLEGLEAGQTYYYSIGTARKTLKTGQFVAKPADTPADTKPGLWDKLRRAVSPPAGEAAKAKDIPAAQDTPAPPARRTWRNYATLRDHFERHGQDFGAKDEEDYATQAWRFLVRAIAEDLPAKQDKDGTLRVWDPKTRAFAAYGLDGRTKTYFKPKSPTYFERQPGRLIRLSTASFPVPR